MQFNKYKSIFKKSLGFKRGDDGLCISISILYNEFPKKCWEKLIIGYDINRSKEVIKEPLLIARRLNNTVMLNMRDVVITSDSLRKNFNYNYPDNPAFVEETIARLLQLEKALQEKYKENRAAAITKKGSISTGRKITEDVRKVSSTEKLKITSNSLFNCWGSQT